MVKRFILFSKDISGGQDLNSRVLSKAIPILADIRDYENAFSFLA